MVGVFEAISARPDRLPKQLASRSLWTQRLSSLLSDITLIIVASRHPKQLPTPSATIDNVPDLQAGVLLELAKRSEGSASGILDVNQKPVL